MLPLLLVVCLIVPPLTPNFTITEFLLNHTEYVVFSFKVGLVLLGVAADADAAPTLIPTYLLAFDPSGTLYILAGVNVVPFGAKYVFVDACV